MVYKREGAVAKLASKLDMFAKPPTMYYRGQSRIASTGGCVISIVIFVIMVAFFMQDLQAYPNLQV